MNLTPDKQTRVKCEAFAAALVDWLQKETARLELEAADVRGVLFGIGIGAALEGGTTIKQIDELVRQCARLAAEQKQK
jgi:hypothetical protein